MNVQHRENGDSLVSACEQASPLVTIIIPAYNRAKYLDECIESALTQDYAHLECIVLDDGSTDNTREVLCRYEGRIAWESHPNMGEQRTVNKGFGLAHGDYITVLSSDDKLLPGAIRAAVDLLQARPEVLVAYPIYCYIDSASQYLYDEKIPDHDYEDVMVGRHFCYVGGGAVFRRRAVELTGGRDPNFRYVGDFDFWLRLGLHGPFARIPRTLAAIRVHPDSASVSLKGNVMAEEHIRLMCKYYAQADLPPEIRKVRSKAFSYARFHAGRTCAPRSRAAYRHYALAVLNNPSVLPEIVNYLVATDPALARTRISLIRRVEFARYVLRRIPVHVRRWIKKLIPSL
jgi:glycosyltransferase involved in cell wall biosynthesis